MIYDHVRVTPSSSLQLMINDQIIHVYKKNRVWDRGTQREPDQTTYLARRIEPRPAESDNNFISCFLRKSCSLQWGSSQRREFSLFQLLFLSFYILVLVMDSVQSLICCDITNKWISKYSNSKTVETLNILSIIVKDFILSQRGCFKDVPQLCFYVCAQLGRTGLQL